ncbi:MAG: SIS domain-containing protein [Hamadaea sp.]|nr:SIS domain-containing protein [Hamadaea sp.]
MGALMEGVDTHLRRLGFALRHLHYSAEELHWWGVHLALTLSRGGRLLTAGNGGSAADAQHLVGELVGRFRDHDRPPLSALALTADGVVNSAIANDFDYRTVFARQVRAHARSGDVVVLISTSGASPNMLAAAQAATEVGAQPWGLTGPAPNPLARLCTRLVAVPVADTQIVQEVHQVAIHLFCGFVEEMLTDVRRTHALAHLEQTRALARAAGPDPDGAALTPRPQEHLPAWSPR